MSESNGAGKMDATDPYMNMAPGMMGGYQMEPMVPEGHQAKAGTPLAEGEDLVTPEAMEAALRTVYDPEIPVNIYDLGLIYDCVVEDDGSANILMTLTAPACPVAGEFPQQVADTVAALDGVGEVTVTLTWDPPWTMEMMSEDAKMALDMY